MKDLNSRLNTVRDHIKSDSYVVMIIGLGSVGSYLLDYLISAGDDRMKLVVVGRDRAKMEETVNIACVSSLIREQASSGIEIKSGVDLNDIAAIRQVIDDVKPDFIVNSSRAYPGLKYGSISWTNFRAYGIWTPLAIKFTKNIMQAWDEASSDAIVINTSYSDVVIPWLKSAGRAYPDFGSGNLNHLVPRIRYAVADMLGVDDFRSVEVVFAAGHFHDVVISKEGHTEGIELPLKVYYRGEEKRLDQTEIFKRCKLPMPTDARRNQMNASSDFRIIQSVVDICSERGVDAAGNDTAGDAAISTKTRLFIPGAFGELGGYPVFVGYRGESPEVWLDESEFSFEEMDEANRRSMYLDGIEDVRDGCLYYTDELIDKVKRGFSVVLPKKVEFKDIEDVAEYLIEGIIKKAVV